MSKYIKYIAIASLLMPFSAGALSVTMPYQGGLGTNQIPTYGQIPVGNSSGVYSLMATSSLGIASGNSASSTLLADTNTWSGTANTFNNLLSAGNLTVSGNSTTTSLTAGGMGGVNLYAVGSGNGTIGFNSSGYNAQVNGYGNLMQSNASTGSFNFFSESNVTAGSPHAHTVAWSTDASGIFYTPQGLISSASSTVNGDLTLSPLANPAGSFLAVNGSGTIIATTSPTGGAGTPGGSNTQIQFNDNNAFGGSADFTWNDANISLNLGASLSASSTPMSLYMSGESDIFITDDLQQYIADSSLASYFDIYTSSEGGSTSLLGYAGIKDGSATQPSFDLSITNTGSSFDIYDSNGVNSVSLATIGDSWMYGSGNFGVGTTTPTSKLHVVGNSLFDGSVTSTSLSSGLLGSNGGLLYGGIATTTATCAGTLSCSTFEILGSSPITLTGAASSVVIPVATSTNEVSGQIPFWTSNSGTPALLGGSTKLSWNSSNNSLLLGSTGANMFMYNSSLNGAMTFTDNVTAVEAGKGSFAYLWQDTAGSISSLYIAASTTDMGNFVDMAVSDSETYLDLQSTATASSELGRIKLDTTRNSFFDTNYNLGVGTTTPAKKLSVQGNVLVSGDLSVAGITATGTINLTGLASGGIGSNNGTLYSYATTSGSTASSSVWSATGNWIKPTGITFVKIVAYGAGGDGGASASGSSGGGGGTRVEKTVLASDLASQVWVTVGTSGGSSSFGTTTVIAYGGGAGTGDSTASGGGGGGSGGAGAGGSNTTTLGGTPATTAGANGIAGQGGGGVNSAAGKAGELGGGAGGGRASNGGGSIYSCPGGGGGGAAGQNGGAGGNINSYSNGGGGTAGIANGANGGAGSPGSSLYCGTGGGGGGDNRAGGNGGTPGGGGGGGYSGAGTGGAGRVYIFSW